MMAFGIDDAITAALRVLDKFVPDPEAKAKAEGELRSSLQLWDKGQTDINVVEAANTNLFVSGWRPFIGWVCGAGFAVQFVIGPLAEWGSALYGHPVKFPQMDTGTMMPLLLGMLGLGGLRTAEKLADKAAK
jgi:hypothetical protein